VRGAAQGSNTITAGCDEPLYDRSAMADPTADRGTDGIPGIGHGGTETQCVEWCPICRTADVLRASTTPEVREQWHEMQREALLTVRALIDHYVRHLEDQRAADERAADEPDAARERPARSRPATPVEEIPPVE
jgi:hypothetical protein